VKRKRTGDLQARTAERERSEDWVENLCEGKEVDCGEQARGRAGSGSASWWSPF
jgi:hypothetical protein